MELQEARRGSRDAIDPSLSEGTDKQFEHLSALPPAPAGTYRGPLGSTTPAGERSARFLRLATKKNREEKEVVGRQA